MLLDEFGFTFAESLSRTMDAVTGWHSTADFLARAADKSSAELRISTAALLLAFLGDASVRGLIETIRDADAEAQDVEGVLAVRALQVLELRDL